MTKTRIFCIACCLMGGFGAATAQEEKKDAPLIKKADAVSDLKGLLKDDDYLTLFAQWNNPSLVRVMDGTQTKNIGWIARADKEEYDICDCENGALIRKVARKSTRSYIGEC